MICLVLRAYNICMTIIIYNFRVPQHFGAGVLGWTLVGKETVEIYYRFGVIISKYCYILPTCTQSTKKKKVTTQYIGGDTSII